MEWGFKESHVAVIALHKSGKSDSQIFKLLKSLKISQNFIYQAIKPYKELWGFADRAWSGCLKSVRAEATIKTVADSPKSTLETEDHVPRAEHINPIKSCLIRDDLHVKAHLRSKGHLLTPALKEIRQTRAERLPQWYAKNRHKNILFTDENFSPSRNNITTRTRFMLKYPLRCILRVQGCHHPSYIMVWWEVSHQGVTHLHFCKKGVKLVSECIKRMCYKEL